MCSSDVTAMFRKALQILRLCKSRLIIFFLMLPSGVCYMGYDITLKTFVLYCFFMAISVCFIPQKEQNQRMLMIKFIVGKNTSFITYALC